MLVRVQTLCFFLVTLQADAVISVKRNVGDQESHVTIPREVYCNTYGPTVGDKV